MKWPIRRRNGRDPFAHPAAKTLLRGFIGRQGTRLNRHPIGGLAQHPAGTILPGLIGVIPGEGPRWPTTVPQHPRWLSRNQARTGRELRWPVAREQRIDLPSRLIVVDTRIEAVVHGEPVFSMGTPSPLGESAEWDRALSAWSCGARFFDQRIVGVAECSGWCMS
jgi:hypothetical protein